MDFIDDNINVTSAGEQPFRADKIATRRELKDEKIRSRIWELDFLRGICVILMLFDHLMFDLGTNLEVYDPVTNLSYYGNDMFGSIWIEATNSPVYLAIGQFADSYWISPLRIAVRPIVILCFFVLCGISCSFSRNNFRRGGILFGCSLLITLVTSLLGIPIRFGVLHMLSISILFVGLVQLICRKNKWAYAISTAVLGIFFAVLGSVLENNVVGEPNEFLYIFSRIFYPGGDYSVDYFPLLPNIGYVLIGASFAPILYPKKRTLFAALDTHFRWYRPVNFFGRNAALFYLIHQVAWFVILALFTIIFIPNGWDLLMAKFMVFA